MSVSAKVFKNGRSQAIRLPKEFRVSSSEVRLTRVAGGILISEDDPWDSFAAGCRELDEGFFTHLENRSRDHAQARDFNAGLK